MLGILGKHIGRIQLIKLDDDDSPPKSVPNIGEAYVMQAIPQYTLRTSAKCVGAAGAVIGQCCFDGYERNF
jgi:hypothetical protein